MYEVGKITRGIQEKFYLSDPAHATPKHLGPLLSALEDMTDKLQGEALRFELTSVPFIREDVLKTWKLDIKRWTERLSGYRAAVASAAPNDPKAILWTVTAPLLLGLYGGPDSDELHRPIDAGTPFTLANQIEFADDFREELWSGLWDDIAEEAKKKAFDWATIAKWVVGGVVVLYVADKVTD